MKIKLYLLFELCLAVVLVKSESTIEIDENGEEYEVKRFHIQGRQLNEGSSQCVVTRRKRAAPPKPMYSYDVSNDEVENKDDAEIIKGHAQQPNPFYSPTIATPTATADDDDEQHDVESGLMNMNEGNEDKGENELMHSMEENKQNKTEENVEMAEEKRKEDNTDRSEVIQLHQLPVLGQLQTNNESVSAISGTNDIVLVHSVDPPKVNPQTHAVFELVPVIDNVGELDEDDDDDDDEDDDNDDAVEHIVDNFDFKEDLTPVTTTAIWSTGDQSLNDLYDDYDANLLKDEEVLLNIRKPLKGNNKKKTSLKPKRKNKYKNNYRRGLKKDNKKGSNNKRIPNKNKKRGQIKNRISNNKHHGSNTRKKLTTKRNRNKKKGEIVDQGINTFSKPMTISQTGNKDDDVNVNCIIIRKDPPTTTPRPFWNIFGRSANGVPQASGHFGKRKRINIRFVA